MKLDLLVTLGKNVAELSLANTATMAHCQSSADAIVSLVAFIIFVVMALICLILVACADSDENYSTVIGVDLGAT